MSTLNIDQARAAFPSLASGFIFGDNAGGSQVAQPVIDRFTDYLINTNAQLGADYSVSAESTRRVVAEAPEEARKLFNAGSTKEIVFGPSSTANLENLARGLEKGIKPGDEFIVTGEHEGNLDVSSLLTWHHADKLPFHPSANAGPWKALAQRSGASVKLWKHTTSNESNPYSLTLRTGAVLPLITSRTRIVAFTACSNILGSIVPVKEFTREIRARAAEVGAENLEISVDCVAYAPHRKIDVQDWDIDFCVFSYYKVRFTSGLSEALKLMRVFIYALGLWPPPVRPLRPRQVPPNLCLLHRSPLPLSPRRRHRIQASTPRARLRIGVRVHGG
jgi:selenocysteine lyase/cysteine desulfurase